MVVLLVGRGRYVEKCTHRTRPPTAFSGEKPAPFRVKTDLSP